MAEFKKGISWLGGNSVDETKLQQMVSNDEYLFDHIIPVRYQGYGSEPVVEGMKIACGTSNVPPAPKTDQISHRVKFGNYFTMGSLPIVQATMSVHPGKDNRTMVVIHGLSPGEIRPTHEGFTAVISHELVAKNANHFGVPQWVHWIAIGY